MKILKASGIVTSYDLSNFFRKCNIDEGMKFGISWKVKKRRKLKTYKILHHHFPRGDDAKFGDSIELEIGKGDRVHRMNDFTFCHLDINHFKP